MNKIVLVTGATDGIGKESALELARRGWAVILHGRKLDRLEKTRKEFSRIVDPSHVFTEVADFTNFSEVREMASRIERRHQRLDALLNNAGVYPTKRVETGDGHEETWQVNYLAPCLLTFLLLNRLRASAPSRIVHVSSQVHLRARIVWDDLDMRKTWDPYFAYGASKLGNALFSAALSLKLDAAQCTSNSLHPGVIPTKLLRAGFGGLGGLSLAQGAETSVYLIDSPEMAGVSGQYFSNKKIAVANPMVLDRNAQERVWEATQTALAEFLK